MNETASARVAVVTGASSGIGLAAARRFVDNGWTVFGLDLSPGDADMADGRYRHLTCDVTSPEEVARAAQEVGKATDRVDALVNNAGGFPEPVAFDDMTIEAWRQTIELNLTSVFLVSSSFLSLLRSSSSPRIVNIGSLSGQAPGWQTSSAYAAAKGGVHALTRAMASDLAREGIVVNSLAPSAVLTDRIRSIRDSEELEATAATIPLGRYQTPAEVAAWIVFLASEEVGFTTGQTISVNGGRFMT